MNELRTEIESRYKEPDWAVEVTEQAIQSSKSCAADDLSSTVTNEAAESSIRAQLKSAGALSRQRVADERLTEEIKVLRYGRMELEFRKKKRENV